MRERWFGNTGRRVPELALEGTLELEGALVLDGVDDDATCVVHYLLAGLRCSFPPPSSSPWT